MPSYSYASLSIAIGIILLYLGGAAGAVMRKGKAARAWGVAVPVTRLAFAAALAVLGMALFLPRAPGFFGLLHADTLSGLLLALVTGLGSVIASYSRRYLEGEPRQARYVACLLLVLGSVSLIAIAANWTVLIAAWIATSFAIHGLLVFYPERPFAVLAAHKKILVSIVGDALLVASAVAAWHTVGSGSFAVLGRYIDTRGAPLPLQVSAVLLVLGVILKTAQLPVHGWLIQVMEAPTPVSALLHAGVVNLGGFVLIRLSMLVGSAPVAQALLVAAGTLTAILAGVVMLTRISIKVRLAWSTCAQIGFMLLECGLGLYDLALVHLIGHSLYKAHAFLTAGESVRTARRARLAPAVGGLGWIYALAAPAVTLALVLGSQMLWLGSVTAAWPLVWSAVLALAWAPLLWIAPPAPLRGFLVGSGYIFALLTLALLWRTLPIMPLEIGAGTQPLWEDVALIGAFATAYALIAALNNVPDGSALARLYRLVYAGFYLDEVFTRLAIRLWPPRLPRQKPAIMMDGTCYTHALESGEAS